MADRLMTVGEVAEYLRVKRSTVYKWAKDGKIPAAKVGRLWRFDRGQIETWVKGGGSGNRQACGVGHGRRGK